MDCDNYNSNEFNFHDKFSKLLPKYDKARLSCRNWRLQNWISCIRSPSHAREKEYEEFGVWQGELINQ